MNFTYHNFINEAKTQGDEFEEAVYFALIKYVNINKLFEKTPIKTKINEILLKKYTNLENDIQNFFNILKLQTNGDIKIKKILWVGKNNNSRDFEVKNEKIISNLTEGSKIADIIIETTQGKKYISVKFGTSIVTLCNIGITKYNEEKTEDLFNFLGINKNIFYEGLNDYTDEIYKIIKDANEITINNNIKIKPPEKIDDQKYLYSWFDDIMSKYYSENEVFVSNYTNWIWKNNGKWYGRTKPHYDTIPDNLISSPNHLNRLLDVVLSLLENNFKVYQTLDSFKNELIDTNEVSPNGKIKVKDNFLKFSNPQKTKNESKPPEIDRDKFKNYQDLLIWSLGKPDEYYIFFGHNKKDSFIEYYDKEYINKYLKIKNVEILNLPNSTSKNLLIKIFTNSIDEYFLSIRNKSGGIKPQILTINQRKTKW